MFQMEDGGVELTDPIEVKNPFSVGQINDLLGKHEDISIETCTNSSGTRRDIYETFCKDALEIVFDRSEKVTAKGRRHSAKIDLGRSNNSRVLSYYPDEEPIIIDGLQIRRPTRGNTYIIIDMYIPDDLPIDSKEAMVRSLKSDALKALKTVNALKAKVLLFYHKCGRIIQDKKISDTERESTLSSEGEHLRRIFEED